MQAWICPVLRDCKPAPGGNTSILTMKDNSNGNNKLFCGAS
jgi:hypothetical protein